MRTSETSVDVCCICQEDTPRHVGVPDSCEHRFCWKCIVKWAKEDSRCPCCKEEITKISKMRGIARMGEIQVPKARQVVEETFPFENIDYESIVCEICAEGQNEDLLLICDGCNRGFHTYCVNMAEVPDDDYFCADCCPDRPLFEAVTMHHTTPQDEINLVQSDDDDEGIVAPRPIPIEISSTQQTPFCTPQTSPSINQSPVFFLMPSPSVIDLTESQNGEISAIRGLQGSRIRQRLGYVTGQPGENYSPERASVQTDDNPRKGYLIRSQLTVEGEAQLDTSTRSRPSLESEEQPSTAEDKLLAEISPPSQVETRDPRRRPKDDAHASSQGMINSPARIENRDPRVRKALGSPGVHRVDSNEEEWENAWVGHPRHRPSSLAISDSSEDDQGWAPSVGLSRRRKRKVPLRNLMENRVGAKRSRLHPGRDRSGSPRGHRRRRL